MLPGTKLVLPRPGDIVRCKFHFQEDPTQFKFRYCLVLAVTESKTLVGSHAIMVAYGTSQHTDALRDDEVLLPETDRAVFSVSGLRKTTKFRLSKTEMIEVSKDNFLVSACGLLSVGVLHPSKVADVAHAWNVSAKRADNRLTKVATNKRMR